MIELLQTVDGLRPGWSGDLHPDEEARLICSGLARAVSGPVPKLNGLQVGYFNLGRHALPDGDLMPIDSVGSQVSLSASGLAKSGAARLMYLDCTVAAGNVTVYDNTAASGTVVIATTALVAGLGTMASVLQTGCYVVLSNAAARVTLGFR
jgi:hypothetical protein